MREGPGVFHRVKEDRKGFVGSRFHISKQKTLGDVGHPGCFAGLKGLRTAGASDAGNALEVGEEFDVGEARGLQQRGDGGLLAVADF